MLLHSAGLAGSAGAGVLATELADTMALKSWVALMVMGARVGAAAAAGAWAGADPKFSRRLATCHCAHDDRNMVRIHAVLYAQTQACPAV